MTAEEMYQQIIQELPFTSEERHQMLKDLIRDYGLQKQNEVLEWVLSEKGQAVIFEAQTREQRNYTTSELVELYQQTIHS